MYVRLEYTVVVGLNCETRRSENVCQDASLTDSNPIWRIIFGLRMASSPETTKQSCCTSRLHPAELTES